MHTNTKKIYYQNTEYTNEEKEKITSKAMMYVRIAHKSLATYAGLFPMWSRNKNKMAEDVERGQKRKH